MHCRRLGLTALLGLVAWNLPSLTAPGAQPQADIGPRRPQRPLEVENPKDFLRMEDEVVEIHVAGSQAKVRALFHFDASTVFRTTIISRLGFPELVGESPLRDFKVAQAVGEGGRYPDKAGGLESLAPVTDIQVERGWSPLDAGTPPTPARWKTWALTLSGSPGAPPEYKVSALVTYHQALTPVAGRKGVQRLSYVLRSGAPWIGPIGDAVVRIAVPAGRVLSATPKPTRRDKGGLEWHWKSFEPTQDVVLLLKDSP